MSTADYQIDGADVNVRSFRHTPSPERPDTRVEGFPGLSDRVAINAPQPGGLLIVEGLLYATGADADAAIDALNAAIEAEEQRMGTAAEIAITLYGRTYPATTLLRFSVLSDVIPTDAPNTTGFMRRVRWVWQRLTTEVTT